MVNGQLSEATAFVVGGVIGILGIVGVVLGVYTQLRKLRQDSVADTNQKVKDAAAAAVKEKESELAFKALTRAIDRMDQTVNSIKTDLNQRINKIECTGTDHIRWLERIEASTKAAHKRLDEHRTIDHGLQGASGMSSQSSNGGES